MQPGFGPCPCTQVPPLFALWICASEACFILQHIACLHNPLCFHLVLASHTCMLGFIALACIHVMHSVTFAFNFIPWSHFAFYVLAYIISLHMVFSFCINLHLYVMLLYFMYVVIMSLFNSLHVVMFHFIRPCMHCHTS